MTKESTPKNIIKMANLFFKYPASKNEVKSILSLKDNTFQKYLYYIKKSGIKISKKQGFYFVDEYKDSVTYYPVETGAIAYMLFLADSFLPDKKIKILKSFIKSAVLLSKKEYLDETKEKFEIFKRTSLYGKYKDKILSLQNHINSNTIVKLTYTKDKKSIIALPQKIEFKDRRLFACFNDRITNQNKIIPVDEILKIESFDTKRQSLFSKETVFELYGKLSKSYSLKETERIIDIKKDRIIVASNEENKELLFKRLMKYDVLAKVLFPKKDILEFNNLIQKSLDNLERFQDNNK